MEHGWAIHRDVHRSVRAIPFFESAKTRFQFHYRYLPGSHSASTGATAATRFDRLCAIGRPTGQGRRGSSSGDDAELTRRMEVDD